MAANAPITIRKIVFVGDSCVGKTTMLMRQASGRFPDEYIPSVFDNYSSGMGRADPLHGLTVFDTAGGEDYDRLRPLSYPGTDVVVICFACINPASLNNVRTRWVPEVSHHLPGVPFILAATKIDLREDEATQRQLAERNLHPYSSAEGKAVAKEVGAARYMETSSLAGIGVSELFDACRNPNIGSAKNNGKFGPVCALL